MNPIEIEFIKTGILYLFIIFSLLFLTRSWKRGTKLRLRRNLRIELANPFKTYILPILIMLSFNIIYIMFFHDLLSPNASFIVLLFSGGIIAPIAEELIFRGLLLGMLFTLTRKVSSSGSLRVILGFAVILSQMFLFMNLHSRVYNFHLFFTTAIYTLLYILNKRNLMPAVIAHVTNNLFVILINL